MDPGKSLDNMLDHELQFTQTIFNLPATIRTKTCMLLISNYAIPRIRVWVQPRYIINLSLKFRLSASKENPLWMLSNCSIININTGSNIELECYCTPIVSCFIETVCNRWLYEHWCKLILLSIILIWYIRWFPLFCIIEAQLYVAEPLNLINLYCSIPFKVI